MQQPYVAQIVMMEYDNMVRREQARVISFDHYSKSVWRSINKTYASMSGSKQYDMAFEVCAQVVSTINSIGAQAGAAQASFGTKSSGIQTLRKIGKTICLSGDTMGHEVRNSFQYETALEDAMFNIITGLSLEERRRICLDDDGRSTFLDKMNELHDLARGYCVFEGLGHVLDELCGLTEENGEEHRDDEGEDEHEEDEKEDEEDDDEEDSGDESLLGRIEEQHDWRKD